MSERFSPDDGWRCWHITPPPFDWKHLEIDRKEWPGSQIVERGQIYPAYNVANLYWREV